MYLVVLLNPPELHRDMLGSSIENRVADSINGGLGIHAKTSRLSCGRPISERKLHYEDFLSTVDSGHILGLQSGRGHRGHQRGVPCKRGVCSKYNLASPRVAGFAVASEVSARERL